MHKNYTKISNLFKEKKRSIKKTFVKDSFKEILNEDDKKYITFLNKKRNVSMEKNIAIKKDKIKEENKNNGINMNMNISASSSKSCKYIKNKINNQEIIEFNSKNKEYEVKNNSIINKDKNLTKGNKIRNADYSDNHFEISSKTKKILNKILSNKKKENEKKKIINQYNIEENIFKKIKQNSIKNTNESTNNEHCIKNDKTSPPKLSAKTIEIMNQLKEERKNRFDSPEISDMEFYNKNSFSILHLKYDELISKKRELRLPIKYKELLNAFNSLEHVININKMRSPYKMNTFENIKKSIEEMTHYSFNMKTLQQILYIVPHFYILKYIKKNDIKTFVSNDDEISKHYDLVIEIPKDYKERMHKNYEHNFNFLSINYYKENDKNFCPNYTSINLINMKKREESFRNILNYIVNIYHKKFLNKENISINFNPLEYKTWHHKFDPDQECYNIPLFEIPLPSTNASNNKNNNISENDTKNDIIKESFINDKIYNNNNSQNSNNIDLKEMNNIYREILIQMKTILMNNENSHKLNNIAELVLNSSQTIKNCFIEMEKMSDTIIKLSKKVKGFISIKKQNHLGYVVALENKEYQIPHNILLDNNELL